MATKKSVAARDAKRNIGEELLEAIGSADFATKARQKLRALKLYESQPERKIEIFDAPPLGSRLYA